MREYLTEIFDVDEHDGFSFTPLENDKYLATEIKPFAYSEKSDYVPGTSLGNKYHIVIYRETEQGEITHQDCFTSILGDPAYYGARLIENGWFGVISRVTENSEEFIKTIYDILLEGNKKVASIL